MLNAISFSIGFRFLSFVFPGLNFCPSSITVPTHPRGFLSRAERPFIGEMTGVQVRVHGKTYAWLSFPALLDFEPMGCRHVWNLQVTIGCGRE